MGVQTPTTGPTHGLNWNNAAEATIVRGLFNDPSHVIEYLSTVLHDLLIENGLAMATPERCQFNDTTKRITAPSSGKPILGIVSGRPFHMNSAYEETSSADSGTTTSLDASGLGESDDVFWAGAWVIFTSGTHSGLVRQIEGYDNTNKRVSWPSNPLGSVVSPGDDFVITWFYIQSLTNGTTNYIYGRECSQTTAYGILHFVATTSATPAAGDILLSQATLDGGGVVTASSNSPTDAARKLYPGIGRYEVETETYAVSGLAAGSNVSFYITHNQFAYIGGREFTTVVSDWTIVVDESHEDDRAKVTVSNAGSYSSSGDVVMTVKGRKLTTL